MQIFLHEKSEMLMMATNRIRRDLELQDNFIRGLALSAFSSITDSDMSTQIIPKLPELISYKPSTSRFAFSSKSKFKNDE